MQEALLSPLATWHNFYSIIGTAAVTLTGLMFVVITLIAGVRVRVSSPNSGIAVFSTPNVFHFGAALLVAALLSAPWQALWPAGLLLGLAGLGGVIYLVIVVRRVRRQTSYQPVLEGWLWHTVLPLVSYTCHGYLDHPSENKGFCEDLTVFRRWVSERTMTKTLNLERIIQVARTGPPRFVSELIGVHFTLLSPSLQGGLSNYSSVPIFQNRCAK